MGKRKTERRSRDTSKETLYPDGMVMPDSEVRRLIGRLRLYKLGDACEHFQLIREATFSEVGGSIDQWSLRLIKQVARESRKTCYGALLKAIVEGVQQDEKGVRAAHVTACRALELVVLHSRFDYITSEQTAGVMRDLLNARRIKPQAYSPSLQVASDSSSPEPCSTNESRKEEVKLRE